eukprot:gnl/TRDRNA2_/TRDRNA2_161891_c0_seq1.p1 gnl/TRDRNA2_/TRDRNA2_161891_c0~~gnl/TRDRNA2_/TRDRNA2_161891_c0_seq1.p1  ORF type:complete len:466 (+),score=135.31 gnl/TRDRNA2_/TRDRNA2_161891_c0_seq1:81-1478(+)
MGNMFGPAEEEEDAAAEAALDAWRPQLSAGQQFAMKRKRVSSASDDSDDASGASESHSEASSHSHASEDKSESEAGSEKEGSEKGDDSEKDSASEAEEETDALAKSRADKRKKKVVVRMEFEPLLSLHDPLATIIEDPVNLLRVGGPRKHAAAIDEGFKIHRDKAILAADWMKEMGHEECFLKEMARALGENAEELKYSLIQSGRFDVDDDDKVMRTPLQMIFDVMENDIETVQEVLEKLKYQVDDDKLRVAVKSSKGELRIKLASDVELIEHADLEAEAEEFRKEEIEKHRREREERRKNKKKKKGENADDDDDDSDDSGDDYAVASGKEAERRALAFRRAQVQRKIEEFLKMYTKGVNLTKINAKGKRYHRRVYVDTVRKSLVIQGASGPKFFPFASMKEVDIETRTTKEGRVETLVICAIEKSGRIVKELNLSFPDQAKANTFVNCVTLFALALRSKAPGYK